MCNDVKDREDAAEALTYLKVPQRTSNCETLALSTSSSSSLSSIRNSTSYNNNLPASEERRRHEQERVLIEKRAGTDPPSEDMVRFLYKNHETITNTEKKGSSCSSCFMNKEINKHIASSVSTRTRLEGNRSVCFFIGEEIFTRKQITKEKAKILVSLSSIAGIMEIRQQKPQLLRKLRRRNAINLSSKNY
jgi:hypothetical protein